MNTEFTIGIREDGESPSPRLLLARIDIENKDREIYQDALESVERLFHCIDTDDNTTIVPVAMSISELLALETMNLPNEFTVNIWSKVNLTHWQKTKDAIRISGTVTIDTNQRFKEVADKLPEIVVFSSGDGAHRGLSDWYPEKEKALQSSLKQGLPFTTGWYASKHEIASARISSDGIRLMVEASVTDDFDTNGYDFIIEKHTDDLERVHRLVNAVWDSAVLARKENSYVDMYAVGHVNDDGSRKDWIETYLVDTSDIGDDEVPGDCYHKWGWQGNMDLPEEVKEAFENELKTGNMPYTFSEFIMEKLGD